MKRMIRQKVLLGLLILTAVCSVIPPRALAVAGSVYFTPNGGAVTTGNEFTVDVRGNVPSPTTWPFYGGGTTMVVSYDASKLQVISYNDSGGVFASGSKNWNGTTSGTVKYQSTIAINAPGVNNQKIISIRFKALAQGNTTLSFGSGTSVNNGPTTGTPSTFSIANPTCPAGQIGTPPNCTTPAPSPSPSPTPSQTPKPSATPKPSSTPAPSTPPASGTGTLAPETSIEETPEPVVESDGGLKIENVKVTANRQKNSVTWTINSTDASPTVTYGTSKSNLKSEASVTKLDNGSYEVVFPSLKLGTLYYFTIKAVTPDQLRGANYSGTLTTRGYPVQLTIQQNGVLAPGAKVKIGERSFVANKNAIITTELGDGEYKATITPAGTTESLEVSFAVQKKPVPASGSPELQSFVLNAALGNGSGSSGGSLLPLIIGGILAMLAAIGGIIGFLLYRRKNQSDDTAAVDGDLLIANYGTAIEAPRANTPAPNLDTAASMAPPATGPPVAYAPAEPTDPATTTPASQLPPDTQQPFDVSALPLPPVDTHPVPPPAEAAPAPQIPQTEQIIEQLSPELAAVESIEETPLNTTAAAPDEPSAIYDASTGELDIIHHHGRPEAPPVQSPLGASRS